MLKWKGLPEPTKKDKVVKEFENNVLIKPIGLGLHVSTREGSSSGLAYIILFFYNRLLVPI